MAEVATLPVSRQFVSKEIVARLLAKGACSKLAPLLSKSEEARLRVYAIELGVEDDIVDGPLPALCNKLNTMLELTEPSEALEVKPLEPPVELLPPPSRTPTTVTAKRLAHYQQWKEMEQKLHENKHVWYAGELDDLGHRACRCISKIHYENVLKGDPSKSPYGICISTLGGSESKKRATDRKSVQKEIHNIVSRDAKCSKYAQFEYWPTEMLYSFASEPHRHLQELIPPIDVFIDDVAGWRTWLLKVINDWKVQEGKRRFYDTDLAHNPDPATKRVKYET